MIGKTEKYHYSVVLLRQMIKTDFKLRYQGSVLGYLWSLLKPLALFTILYLVFVKFLRFGDALPYFASYLLLGIILWSFFTEVTTSGLNAIVGRGDMLRKLSFPRYVVVLSTAASAFINLAINLGVLAVFMVIQGVQLRVAALWLPLILIELFMLAVGFGFLLSALYVRYRDISHIWEVFLQGLFYATPIIYPTSLIPQKYAGYLLLNPIAQLIQDARYSLITPSTQTLAHLSGFRMYAIPLAITLVVSVCSAFYFKKRSKFFAEEI